MNSGNPCRTGDKEPFVPQSDDQFFVWNYVTDRGLIGFLMRRGMVNHGYTVAITVPDLNLHNALPFDHDLHEVAERLREELRNA